MKTNKQDKETLKNISKELDLEHSRKGARMKMKTIKEQINEEVLKGLEKYREYILGLIDEIYSVKNVEDYIKQLKARIKGEEKPIKLKKGWGRSY